MSMIEVEVLRAACCIAGLDKQIDDNELKLLRKLAHRVGVGEVSLDAMIRRAREDQNFYQEQFRYLHADPQQAMTTLFGLAVADGQLTLEERVILRHFAERLELSEAQFEKLLAAAESYLDGHGSQKTD
jgi:tellurite resistance protein